MTYNRDLQEDKERLFDTVDTVRACLRLFAAMLDNTTANLAPCAAAAQDPALLATDLAEYLVRQNVPFRHAHHAVGRVVALAEKLGCGLNKLSLAELQSVDSRFGPDALHVFDPGKALARRKVIGSPGTQEVHKQLKRWKALLKR